MSDLLTSGAASHADEREFPRDYRRFGADHVVVMRGRSGPGARFHSLASLEQRTSAESTLPVAALIFHCSRCGSTLLARLLALDPALRVFAEPAALPRFLAAHAAALRRGEAVRELQTFIRAFGLAPASSERGLVVKLTSRAIAYLPVFRAAFPGTPFVYLFRDPTEIVASLELRPPPFEHEAQRIAVAADFDPSPSDVAPLSPMGWHAWYVDRNLRLALRHRSQFVEVIDYADHARRYLDFARGFRRAGASVDTMQAARVLGSHSKDPTVAFKSANLPVLTAEQREAVLAVAGKAFGQLLQQSGPSPASAKPSPAG